MKFSRITQMFCRSSYTDLKKKLSRTVRNILETKNNADDYLEMMNYMA